MNFLWICTAWMAALGDLGLFPSTSHGFKDYRLEMMQPYIYIENSEARRKQALT